MKRIHFIVIAFLTMSCMAIAQENIYKHSLQIGYYKAEFTWPGIGMQYQYRLTNNFSLVGGLLMYNRQSPFLSIVDYMSSRENQDRLFAQVPYYEPVNQSNLGKDEFDLHNKIYDNTLSLFMFEPEIGIGYTTPAFFWKCLQFTLNYTMRLVTYSSVFLTEMGPMYWNSEDTEYRYYTIYYYQRNLGPIGFNLSPALQVNVSKRTFLGFHFYLHGYSAPFSMIHQALLYPFYSFSASYGFVLGTKF